MKDKTINHERLFSFCWIFYNVEKSKAFLLLSHMPPLCKGRWLAKQDGGIVFNKFHSKQSLTRFAGAPFTQGSRFLVFLKIFLQYAFHYLSVFDVKHLAVEAFGFLAGGHNDLLARHFFQKIAAARGIQLG